jgi:hypothetical protein
MAPVVQEEQGKMMASAHQMKDFILLTHRIQVTQHLEELFVAIATRVLNGMQYQPGTLEMEKFIRVLSACPTLRQVTMVHYHLTTGCDCKGSDKFFMKHLRKLPVNVQKIHCGTQRLVTAGEELVSIELTRS